MTWSLQQIADLNGDGYQGVFTMEYQYDIQGNLLETIHNQYRIEQTVWHQYDYDEDQRLVRATFKASMAAAYEEQAEYHYYIHGPLKREELADDLQGIDYTYTLDGRLKAINHPELSNLDPGQDGYTGDNSHFAGDVFGMALDYYPNDYLRTGTSFGNNASATYHNGLIQAFRWQTLGQNAPNGSAGVSMYEYGYDERYQLQQAVMGTYASATFTATDDYKVWGLTYDENGNLKTLNRNAYAAGSGGQNMDQLTYRYEANNPNRLSHIEDAVAGSNYNDLSGQTGPVYTYNAIGQLTTDASRNLTMTYNAYGQVATVTENSSLRVTFTYHEGGQRLSKVDHALNQTTYYIRDASGNVMSIFEETGTTLTQEEILVYGAGRVGLYHKQSESYQYELSDHLGNVRAVVSGKDANGDAIIDSHADYYPFGWSMPGREMIAPQRYRYAYQGIEKDEETGWSAFELRMYDARTARWMSPDPYGQYYSPYLAMGNDPVGRVDPDGGLDFSFLDWGGLYQALDTPSRMDLILGFNWWSDYSIRGSRAFYQIFQLMASY